MPMEKQSAHTQGPWRIKEGSRHSPEECDLTICGGIFLLADINGPNYSHCEANARLIAAAPDLLAAVEAIVAASRDGDLDRARMAEWNEAFKLCRAALSRATSPENSAVSSAHR